MIKMSGILMIIGSSGFLGSYIYKTLKNRCDILKEMLNSIDILQAEIVFRRSDLPSALKTVAERTKGYVSLFWSETGQSVSENQSVQAAFEKGLNLIKNKGITKEDAAVISTLSGIIGKYDSLEQAQMMKNIKELINVQWLEGNRELTEKGKLYRALGVSFGIVVALVMI